MVPQVSLRLQKPGAFLDVRGERGELAAELVGDLHLHTTASDGLWSPARLVQEARARGLGVIAVTDHDTVGGLEEAAGEAHRLGLEFIGGIELSSRWKGMEIHILGYFVDPNSRALRETLQQFIDSRLKRAAQMVERLNQLGYEVSWPRVQELAGTEFVGRPHIARALVEKGYISEMRQAFSPELIGNDGRAFVDRFRLEVAEATALVRKSGGLPVLAHPGYLVSGQALEREQVLQLVELGLSGLEVFYSGHTPEQEEYYRRIAQDRDLVLTGGSDCHGEEDGPLLGSVRLPYAHVEGLRRRWHREVASGK